MRKSILFVLLLSLFLSPFSFAQEADGNSAPAIPSLEINIKDSSSNQEMASSIKLLLLLAVIAVAPSVLLLTTCFVRIAVVLDFVKRSLSLQNTPPNQLILGLAIFLTIFVMWPVFDTIYTDSFKPFSNGEIDSKEMYSRAEEPLRLFMYNQLKAQGKRGRVVSVPAHRLFLEQSAEYRESVLPKSVKNRVAIEAACEMSWEKLIGDEGKFIGMSTYGASAPADLLYKKFGITAENVVKAVLG